MGCTTSVRVLHASPRTNKTHQAGGNSLVETLQLQRLIRGRNGRGVFRSKTRDRDNLWCLFACVARSSGCTDSSRRVQRGTAAPTGARRERTRPGDAKSGLHCAFLTATPTAKRARARFAISREQQFPFELQDDARKWRVVASRKAIMSLVVAAARAPLSAITHTLSALGRNQQNDRESLHCSVCRRGRYGLQRLQLRTKRNRL